MPSFSPELERTLSRALESAVERRHEYSTLEHLLLALTQDDSASKVMMACGVNLEELGEVVTNYLDTELDALKIPIERPRLTKKEEEQLAIAIEQAAAQKEKKRGEAKQGGDHEDATATEKLSDTVRSALSWEQFQRDGASPTAGFQRVVQRSILHTQSSGRDEVDGARVLVALFSERESYAVFFLQQQDMSRLDAVSYISHGIGKGELRESPREETSKPAPRYLDKFSAYRSVMLDMKPHVDSVSLQPTLATPRIAEKIVDFISELALLHPGNSVTSNCALTIGVFGPWGSGKSTLLSKISEIFRKDGAVVVSVNAWKWDGEKSIYSFMTEQLLASLSASKAFKWRARLIRAVIYVRRRFKAFAIAASVLTAALILFFFVDWSNISIGQFTGQGSLFALLGAGTIGALAKPVASLAEKWLIRPKSPPEPGVQLSQAFKYLMVAKQIGDTAGKPIIFVFDDLDRCDPDRVMKFMGSIQNLTIAGAINVIGCDDRIISSAIYKQFKEIADLSGEKKAFGTKFLEKIVQVHFRMPELNEKDLEALGIKPTIASASGQIGAVGLVAAGSSTAPQAGTIEAREAEPLPIKDIDVVKGNVPDEIALSVICGEVLGAILKLYHLPIRKVKFLANVMKLYAMIFPPTDIEAAFRIAAFVGIANVDEEWLRNFYERVGAEVVDADNSYADIHAYLGSDKDLLAALYLLCGIGVPRVAASVAAPT